MSIKNWDTVKTAFVVAQYKTVSTAAKKLGLHRATVIRHIDALEDELDCKLFHRHQKGYAPTDIGKQLLLSASIAEEQFSYLRSVATNKDELTGELIVTSLDFLAPFVLPAISAITSINPKLKARYLSKESLLELEKGDAHIAFRTGEKPDHPDYLVVPFKNLEIGLYATRKYVEKYGQVKSIEDFRKHQFIVPDSENLNPPPARWLKSKVAASNIVLKSNNLAVTTHSILAGLGIGLMLKHEASNHKTLVQIFKSQANWSISNWIVTHRDLHSTPKVQAFLKAIRATAAQY
jgi:DNA-binding transcriptional LysR family regulator